MSDTLPQHNPELRKIWDTVFRLPLPLQRESSLFLIVSVLDVLMTSLLLGDLTGVTGRTIFYESNPVARFFLERWDLGGIVYFKFATVGLVEVIAHLVAMKKVAVARRLLEFGTLVVSVVVIYSMVLLVTHR
jgi:hypothetical protein